MERIINEGTIGGISAEQLANEYGTPLYVYDANEIRERYGKLKTAFSDYPARIHYAAKACTNLHIMKLLKSEGSALDTVSINEAKLGLLAGFTPEEILYTPSSVSMHEVKEALALGIHVVIDNLDLLKKFGQEFKGTIPCSVRLNPDILAGGHEKIQVGHKESKFGIPAYQLGEIVSIKNEYHINIRGLHCHVGSEISGAEPFMKILDLLLGALPDFPEANFVDIGSGFKVPYYRHQPEEDLFKLGQTITRRMTDYSKESGRKPMLFIEPGKYLVGAAGYFIAEVRSLKQIHEHSIVGLNSGFNHLLRPMFYDAFHEIVNVSNPRGLLKPYTVVGNICETDLFARNREISEIREGDLLVFLNAGAYGFSMSSNYNSHGRPAEVLVSNGKSTLIRRRETFEDIVATQIETFNS